MRRVGNPFQVLVPGVLVLPKRFARRRHDPRDADVVSPSVDTLPPNWSSLKDNVQPNVSSLRSGTMMAAPATTSLDKIRFQLAQMRSENNYKIAQEKATAEQKQWEEMKKEQLAQKDVRAAVDSATSASKDEELTRLIQREYARLYKPNDVFESGKEVVAGVAQRSFLLRQKRYRDADEVLRKSDQDEDTKRYMKLAFASSSEKTKQLVELLQQMRAVWTQEHKKLSDGLDAPIERVDSDAMARLAWIEVLEQLSDQELRFLWETEILDVETLESLFNESPDAFVDASEEEQSTVSSTGLVLDEKIDYVQRLHYLQELTNAIRETELGDVPSIDLAPTLVKVQRRQFVDISEEELRRLEQHGEATAMRLTADGVRQPPAGQANGTSANASVNVHVDVPASMLDRALTPSNAFLSAVAEKDAALKKSLETMERIKRQALLDPEFQEAVRFAHAVEEASVAPHIHGLSYGQGSAAAKAEDSGNGKASPTRTAQNTLSKRERRAARSQQVRGPMARSPYSPEVVPYFYNDQHSIVPPRGAFNLPDPTPTKAERAESRGRRRRAHERSRYRK